MSNRRWWFVAGAVAASAAASTYLFDAKMGRSRRIRIVERFGHFLRASRSRVRREVRYRSKAAGARARHLMAGGPGFVDGSTLLDRVESELFADPKIPHGSLNIEVEGKTVVLRGQLSSRKEIDRVERAVLKVPGVWQINSLLHLPGTAAPNKLPSLLASAVAAVDEERWPEEPPPDVDAEGGDQT